MQNSYFKISLKFGICLYLVSCILVFASSADATSVDPMKLGIGARSIAMGRTNMVVPGDINATLVNPANAAFIKNWELTSMYTSLLEGDINYTLLGGGGESVYGGWAAAYLAGGTTGIQVSSRDATGRVVPTGSSFDYSNSVIALSWGKMFQEKIAYGATLKLFSKSFSGYSSGSGLDVDLGMLYMMRPDLNFGLTLQNALPTGISWSNGTGEDVPMNLKGGLSWQAREDIQVLADVDLLPFSLHSGVEWWVNPKFALRGGLDQVSAGGESAVNICLGMGTKFQGVTFDYAYYMDSSLAANTTHYFSFGFIGGPIKMGPKPAKPAEKPKPAPATVKETPKPAKSDLVIRIEAYTKQLEAKLAAAKKPDRIATLKKMIAEQKIRLQKELAK